MGSSSSTYGGVARPEPPPNNFEVHTQIFSIVGKKP